MPAKSWDDEDALLAQLRAGDEVAFARLVDRLHSRLVAMARTFTSSPGLAEDIAQETWLGVIRGLRGFEGRSSLRTWIFGILVRRARTLARRESRRAETAPKGSLDAEWVPGAGRVGLWIERPTSWGFEDPAVLFQMREALEVVQRALAALPPLQRQVVLLRDVEDLSSFEICNILDVSETNQRVLLHRGRARIRSALDRFVRSRELEYKGDSHELS